MRWGWRTDAKGVFTKLPLEKVPDGVPSSTFLKAAGIWNPGKSSTGKDNLDLPIPDVQVTSGPVTLRPAGSDGGHRAAARHAAGDREPDHRPAGGRDRQGRDGPHTGVTGDVDGPEWANIKDERA